jgi:hypothetical protein
MMHIHIPGVAPVRLAKAAAESLLAVVIVLGAIEAPLAADCLEQPKAQTVQAGRWYYWRDAINHRKCWYLQQQSPSTDTPTAQYKTAVEGTTSLSSFLSSLFSARLSVVSSAPPQQDAATIAPAPSAGPGVPEKSSPSYERRRLVWRAKRTEGLAQVDQKKPGRGDQQYLDPAQREALFQEFLRWRAWQEQAQLFNGQ